MSNIQQNTDMVLSEISNNGVKVSQKDTQSKTVLEPTKLLFLKNRLQTTIV